MPAIGNSHIVGAEDTRQSIQSFNSHSIKPQNIRNTQPYRLAYALANQLSDSIDLTRPLRASMSAI